MTAAAFRKKPPDTAEKAAKAGRTNTEGAPSVGIPAFLGGVASGSGAPAFLQRKTAETGAAPHELGEEGTVQLLPQDPFPSMDDEGDGAGDTAVQPKLEINTPGDAFEREADRVAEAVTGRRESVGGALQSASGPSVQRSHAKFGSTNSSVGSRPSGSGQESLQRKEGASAATPKPTANVAQAVAQPGAGRPIPDTSRRPIEAELGRDLSHVRVHEGHSAAEAASSIHAKAFTHKNHIWLGRGQSAHDTALMAHEATHTVQQGRGLSGPHLIQRAPDDDGGVCELTDESHSSSTSSHQSSEGQSSQEDSSAGTCELDESAVIDASTQGLASPSTGPLTCEPEPIEDQICELPFADASFDPEAVDVAGMRNDTLNSESIRVDEWTATHGETSPPDPDVPAYRRLQQRLKNERALRVQSGHLWMTTAVDPAPDQFYMLHLSAGESYIISVDAEYATGTVSTSLASPIMTTQQFQDHLDGLEIPILTEEEYIERLQETAREIAPELLVPPDLCTPENPDGVGTPASTEFQFFDSSTDFYTSTAYTGQMGRLDPLHNSIQETYPWSSRNRSARMGEIAEGAALRHLSPHGAQGFDNGRLLWNGYNSPRVDQRGIEGDYQRPRGLDWLQPIRRGRDNTPAVDIDLTNFHGGADIDPALASGRFDALSVKMSMVDSPSLRARYGYYLNEIAALNDTQRNNLAQFRDLHRPGQSLDDVASRIGLAVPEVHAEELRTFLRDPHGIDASASGGRALTPNWAQLPSRGPRTPDRYVMRPHYATTSLPEAFVPSDNGAPIRNGAEALEAFRNGRITEPQFNSLLSEIGEVAASRVVGFPMLDNMVRWHQSYRESLPSNNARDIRAGMSSDVIDVLERERQMSGDADAYVSTNRRQAQLQAAHAQGLRGAGMGTGLSLGVNVLSNPGALADSNYRWQLAERTAVEFGANYATDFGEHALRSSLGLHSLERGVAATAPKMVAGRLAARALPGLADAFMEVYDMGNEDREHSATEVIVRTGRAAVIGGGSAYAGAAVGTAIGGPVGFVVGLGVGLFVGWLGNKITPYGGEHWREREIRRRQEAERRRRERERERRIAEATARLERLYTPLSSNDASTVGVEGLFALPTSNPLFMASEPGVEPTIGELEREYLMATLLIAQQDQMAPGP